MGKAGVRRQHRAHTWCKTVCRKLHFASKPKQIEWYPSIVRCDGNEARQWCLYSLRNFSRKFSKNAQTNDPECHERQHCNRCRIKCIQTLKTCSTSAAILLAVHFYGCQRKWHQRHMYSSSFGTVWTIERRLGFNGQNCNRIKLNKRQMNRWNRNRKMATGKDYDRQ